MSAGGAIRVLVVDDEPLARRNLTLLLGRDADIAQVEECGSGRDALAHIRRSRPDLVFLDIQMPECDGFDVLEYLGEDRPPVIVFVTAHDEHALRAFEAGALDYLLKPFTDGRFARALTRAKERLGEGRGAGTPGGEPLIVRDGRHVRFVKREEIDWIEAANYYAALHVGADTHIVRRSLATLERELKAGPFCRIHRSTIINVERVRGLTRNGSGEYVLLGPDTRLPLGRRYRQALKERLGIRQAGAEPKVRRR